MAGEDFLELKLEERRANNALRRLRLPEGMVDLCSNDYLGMVTDGWIEKHWGDGVWPHGSMGSRLLAGNYPLAEEVEGLLADFHGAPAGLLFNSGYDANLGILSSVPQRGDTILYDELSHASIRDGMRLSFARAFGFAHNDCSDLERRLARTPEGTVFVVTESVFSMDGDMAPLAEMVALCDRYGAHLIVDEAHATGVVGPAGAGLVQELGLEAGCFARVHTFGKAVGCHGAVVLGSERLKSYLVNFSRSFIYTTALPPAAVRAIAVAYGLLPSMDAQRSRLRALIARFAGVSLPYARVDSVTPIQAVIIPGNDAVKRVAGVLQEAGLDVRPILSPTVPAGSERLRIVLHAFNTEEEVDKISRLIAETGLSST
jgi:8-amino-7-oxononanoate synthase